MMSDAEVDRVLQEAERIISSLQCPPSRAWQEDRAGAAGSPDVTACDAASLFSSEAIDLTDDADGTFADLFGL